MVERRLCELVDVVVKAPLVSVASLLVLLASACIGSGEIAAPSSGSPAASAGGSPGRSPVTTPGASPTPVPSPTPRVFRVRWMYLSERNALVLQSNGSAALVQAARLRGRDGAVVASADAHAATPGEPRVCGTPDVAPPVVVTLSVGPDVAQALARSGDAYALEVRELDWGWHSSDLVNWAARPGSPCWGGAKPRVFRAVWIYLSDRKTLALQGWGSGSTRDLEAARLRAPDGSLIASAGAHDARPGEPRSCGPSEVEPPIIVTLPVAPEIASGLKTSPATFTLEVLDSWGWHTAQLQDWSLLGNNHSACWGT